MKTNILNLTIIFKGENNKIIIVRLKRIALPAMGVKSGQAPLLVTAKSKESKLTFH